MDSAYDQSGDTKYRRNYKACLNCRTRKVKCDLGSVEQPEPPCVRCRRERKECVFAESRRGGSQPGSRHKRKGGQSLADTQQYPAVKVQRQNPQETHIHTGLGMPQQSPSLINTRMPIPAVLNQSSGSSDQQHAPSRPQAMSVTSITNQEDATFPPTIASSEPLTSVPKLNSSTTSETHADENNNLTIPPNRSSEFSTMQGALVFLARAAGTMAKADDRDNINAIDIHAQLETQESSSSINSPVMNQSAATSRQNSAATATADPKGFDSSFAPLIRPDGSTPTSLPPVTSAAFVHPRSRKRLTDIGYIGEGKMLTEAEAVKLVRLFFLTLHPFFPHIPQQLHSPDVLAGYPILLCAILTIASRYHPFGNQGIVTKESRNIQLHERLWIYCQRLISQTVWAEASTRSIGTALAFLLFTEWNPRAIHWRWSDYANNPDVMDGEIPQSEDDSLTGLSAMRRSDRMAWMLIGTSVRLSQDMGFITGSPEIFVATHLAETHTAMSLGQRSMLAQSLGEVDLDNADEEDISGSKKFQYDEFILSLDEETMRRRSMQKKALKFTFSQKAKLEILKIMSLAYETIYVGGNGATPRQNLTVLGVFSPLIDNWYRTYRKLLKPSNPKNFNQHCNLKQASNIKHVSEITKQIDKESLICDYYYCQLYIYSLALSIENPLNTNVSDAKKPLNNIRLDDISKASKFVEIAYNSALEILNAAIRVHKLKLLKYMPVRWVTRIVRSVAFIVKCFLTLTNRSKSQQGQNIALDSQTSAILTLSIIPIEDILQTIQKAAIVLREASPDELHLCTRYSTILMYLCTEMKHRTKFSTNAPEMRKLDEGDDEEEEDIIQEDAVNPRPELRVRTQSTDYIPQRALFQDPFPPTQQQSEHLPEQPQPQPPSQPEGNGFMYPTASSNDLDMSYQQMGGNQLLPDTVIDWFLKNDEAIGLDFVEPWTEMLEQQLGKKGNE